MTEVLHSMRLESFGTDVAFVGEAVRAATHFMRRAERDAIKSALTKANTSPVTVADFVVQAFVASRLARHFPDDPLVAEVDASALRADTASAICERVVALVGQMLPGLEVEREQVLAWIDRGSGACGRRFWTLDPIDGTKGLLRGGHYVIALALVTDGRVQIGILGCPRLSATHHPS